VPSFTVTAAAQEVQLDGTGAAQAQYTVTNTSAFELTGRLIATPQSPARPEWFSIQGTSTRDFEPGAAEQVLLQISVPAGTPAGTYTVRLDAVSEATPDEDFTEGPSVSFDVRPAAPPPPPWWRRWWWLILIGVVVLLIVIGVVIWLATRGGGSSACSRQVGARKAPITTFPNVVTIVRPPVVTFPTDTTTPAPPPPPPTTTTACP
jgi:hypothetical protein